MPVDKIIIDNKKTKAERISPEKIQLDLVATPMDEENDAEPNLNLNLYINGELLKTLQSDENGFVKENLVVNDEGGEQVMIKLEDVISGIQSKIKCIMIEGGNDKVESKEIIIPKDKQKIIEFVKKNGRNLSDEKCKDYINDFDVVMEAVKNDPLSLQFASDNLKNNYDIVMEAVIKNGLALKLAHPSIKDSLKICMTAINQNVLAYDYCGELILNNNDILEIILNLYLEKGKSIYKQFKKIPTDVKDDLRHMYNSCNYFPIMKYSFFNNNKKAIIYLSKTTDICVLPMFIKLMSETLKNDLEFNKEILDSVSNRYYSSFSEKYNYMSDVFCAIYINFKDNLEIVKKILDIVTAWDKKINYRENKKDAVMYVIGKTSDEFKIKNKEWITNYVNKFE